MVGARSLLAILNTDLKDTGRYNVVFYDNVTNDRIEEHRKYVNQGGEQTRAVGRNVPTSIQEVKLVNPLLDPRASLRCSQTLNSASSRAFKEMRFSASVSKKSEAAAITDCMRRV